MSGSVGASGATGSTGATGSAGLNAEDALWIHLDPLGTLASVEPGSTFPACFTDTNGQVFLRGQVRLNPVPLAGGLLIGVLPSNSDNECKCTPEEKDLITTTTALAFPPNGGSPDVCIVRLLISSEVSWDFNKDLVVDVGDMIIVEDAPEWNDNVNDPTITCFANTTEPFCNGRDLNQDGRVNLLDTTTMTNSFALGTSVRCGAVYATDFSCGSTRQAPLQPAVSVSLDTIQYFNDDGLLLHAGIMSMNRRSNANAGLVTSILVEFEQMRSENAEIKSENAEIKSENAEIKSENAEIKAENAEIKSENAEIKSEIDEVKSENAKLEAKVDTKASKSEFETFQSRFSGVLESTRLIKTSSNSLVVDMIASVAAVVACALLVFVIAKRR